MIQAEVVPHSLAK